MERMTDSVIELHVEEGKLFLIRFFCSFGPCVEGFWKGFIPYLSVDSTTLNDRWNSHLLLATSVDGHNWMYHVAFDFFQSESKESLT
jgi:hypothetical protein